MGCFDMIKCIRFALVMIGLFLGTLGCAEQNRIEEKVLPIKNPVTYDFDASIGQVQAAIKQARGEGWQDTQNAGNGGELIWKSDGNPFAKKIFDDPKNQNDAYLCGMGDAVGKSRVYFKDREALTYYADFQIHLTAISASKTRVQIVTFDSRVKAGSEWGPFVRAGVFLTVEPTTIEEYQLLLDIGKQMSQSDMPQMFLPDPSKPGKAVVKPRHR
jgi:hypothetical protein